MQEAAGCQGCRHQVRQQRRLLAVQAGGERRMHEVYGTEGKVFAEGTQVRMRCDGSETPLIGFELLGHWMASLGYVILEFWWFW